MFFSMRRSLLASVFLATCLVSLAFPAVVSCSVGPFRAGWSAWARSVSQVVVCNFDSLACCELFVGVSPGDGRYLVEVREYPDSRSVALSCPVSVTREHSWLRFDEWRFTGDFIKGKQYEFRFVSTAPGCSINYYYRVGGAYEYGWLRSEEKDRKDRDLVCRVRGRMDRVDSTYWGAYPYFPMGGETWGCSRSTWKARVIEAGLHQARLRINWVWVDSVPRDTWQFAMLDTQYVYLMDSIGGCDVYANLHSCTRSTSTHIDKIEVTDGRIDTFWSIVCPPRNLFLSVDDDSNFWARFVERTVRHYDSVSAVLGCDSIRVFEIWNEPNVLKDYWRCPNARDYVDLTSVRERCSIYVRLCEVANSVITGISGHEDDRILVGSIGDLESEQFGAGGDTLILKGKVWLRWMYEIATHPGGPGVFWDGVAFHFYSSFSADKFVAHAETLRAMMRDNDDCGELWITEVGWTTPNQMTEERQANTVAEVFTTALASAARPGGGYDRTDWFCFRNTRRFHHGFADTLMQNLKYSFRSFAQVASLLTGKRFNQRVLLGDARDDSVRIYEFENPADDKRLWVCWKGGGVGEGVVQAAIPVRSDELAAESLAYGAEVPSFGIAPDSDGWLRLELSERPVFVWETGRAERPDLVVDSVTVEPAEPEVGRLMTIRAWVRNTGNRITPEGYATRVDFYVEGELFGGDQSARQIEPGETGFFESGWIEVSSDMAGPVLVSARVNPGQRFVELDMNNNRGYVFVEIR